MGQHFSHAPTLTLTHSLVLTPPSLPPPHECLLNAHKITVYSTQARANLSAAAAVALAQLVILSVLFTSADAAAELFQEPALRSSSHRPSFSWSALNSHGIKCNVPFVALHRSTHYTQTAAFGESLERERMRKEASRV